MTEWEWEWGGEVEDPGVQSGNVGGVGVQSGRQMIRVYRVGMWG